MSQSGRARGNFQSNKKIWRLDIGCMLVREGTGNERNERSYPNGKFQLTVEEVDLFFSTWPDLKVPLEQK